MVLYCARGTSTTHDGLSKPPSFPRMFKLVVLQGRGKQKELPPSGTDTGRAGASPLRRVEPLSDVRTQQEASFNILNAGLSPHSMMDLSSPHLSLA